MERVSEGRAISSTAELQKRFGFFGGVFTPSILTILGVIMFLRMGWVVGNVGLGGALLIVLMAHAISIVTGLSVSSIATNRQVKTGGAYYMISRSLGAAVGTAIGIPLFFAQAISVTFYIVGFTESLAWIWPGINHRLVGTVTLLLLTVISMKSSDLAIRLQYVIMGVIALSLISFFWGKDFGGEVAPQIQWFVTDKADFSYVFAVFFPAVTGIMAGVSMSGDLKDPRRAIPLGTMLAIGVGLIIYLLIPVVLALRVPQEHLLKDSYAMWKVSAVPFLISLGVWGATLSSALGSLLAAPRTLQALAMDGLAPSVFARTFGQSPEPRAGLALTFIIAEIGILLGNLNMIAPILTMFFLVTYGITNLACGLERWAQTPSFRPSFKIPAWVSLLGAFGCFYVMSVINLPAMLIALFICLLLFSYAERRQLGNTWGDARNGIWAALLRSALINYHRSEYHPINWRPNLIILGGNPKKRSYLLEIGSAIAQEQGIVSYFYLIQGPIREKALERETTAKMLEKTFNDKYPNVFYRVEIVDDIFSGALAVTQSYGVGKFEANTVLMGWPKNPERPEKYTELYCNMRALKRSILLFNYDQKRGFGKYKNIHIWWGGWRDNASLILILPLLIKSHPKWRGAELSIFVAIEKEETKKQVEENLQRILDEVRLDAKIHVIVRDGHPIESLMKGASYEADLAIIGFKAPEIDSSPRAFFERYNRILEVLPSTILACSAATYDSAPMLFQRE